MGSSYWVDGGGIAVGVYGFRALPVAPVAVVPRGREGAEAMSWQCTSWALREAPCPNASARLVLIALADRCQPDGRSAWPTIETLTAEAHCSRATVKRALHDMEVLGVIRRGDQDLARHDEHGRWLAPQWRPIVWECCMNVALEKVSEKPGRKARAEREGRKGRGLTTSPQHAEPERPDSGGSKMSPQTEPGSDHGEPARRYVGEPSGGFTGEPLDRKTDITTNRTNTPLSLRETSPQGEATLRNETKKSEKSEEDVEAERLCAVMAEAMRREPKLPVPPVLEATANPSRPRRRELAAANRLIAVQGLARCRVVAQWALLPADGTHGSPRDGFWRKVIAGPAALERKWDRVVAQMACDPKGAVMLAQAGAGPGERHRAIKVSTPNARAVPVWGAGEFHTTDSQTHIDGDLPGSQCPLCRYDERNRETHGLGRRNAEARKAQENAKTKSDKAKDHRRFHFIGGEGYCRQLAGRGNAS
ncbi:helix-turn-helix domain-containing protein [Bifidobacterium sp. ESL0784]|uniref:helix-turn-helix domain-containing protein n=1 Tax=Bifidobacterium sp. ESL0784 TaxID=2983231 RepID=UPI0023F97B8C|nr:helix-turn-helix domain-containing protein [Bifidobacterium sp. ESL0784]MDF7641469.1 helix-turn-helix domain-containing protein [Bifidobacterium sp. ESL0784]